MTEDEWVAADWRDVRRLVDTLSPRRQRLLAAAACRALGEWVDYPAAHTAIETVETFADTGKSKAALRRARQAVMATRQELYNPPRGQARLTDGGVELALFVVQVAASENAVSGTISQAIEALVIAEGIPEDVARRRMYAPFWDIAGHSTGRTAFDRRWLTTDVVALARTIYDDRAFDRQPILADALMDAGCTDQEILTHSRSVGPHTRGCWVIDLLLGKG